MVTNTILTKEDDTWHVSLLHKQVLSSQGDWEFLQERDYLGASTMSGWHHHINSPTGWT